MAARYLAPLRGKAAPRDMNVPSSISASSSHELDCSGGTKTPSWVTYSRMNHVPRWRIQSIKDFLLVLPPCVDAAVLGTCPEPVPGAICTKNVTLGFSERLEGASQPHSWSSWIWFRKSFKTSSNAFGKPEKCVSPRGCKKWPEQQLRLQICALGAEQRARMLQTRGHISSYPPRHTQGWWDAGYNTPRLIFPSPACPQNHFFTTFHATICCFVPLPTWLCPSDLLPLTCCSANERAISSCPSSLRFCQDEVLKRCPGRVSLELISSVMGLRF